MGKIWYVKIVMPGCSVSAKVGPLISEGQAKRVKKREEARLPDATITIYTDGEFWEDNCG